MATHRVERQGEDGAIICSCGALFSGQEGYEKHVSASQASGAGGTPTRSGFRSEFLHGWNLVALMVGGIVSGIVVVAVVAYVIFGVGATSGNGSVVMTCNEFNNTYDLYATYAAEDVDAAIEFCSVSGKGLPDDLIELEVAE